MTASRSSSSVGGAPRERRRPSRPDPIRRRLSADGDVGDPAGSPQHRLDRLGPDVLPAGDDQLVASTLDVAAAVVDPSAEVTGGEPAVDAADAARRGRPAESIGARSVDLAVGGERGPRRRRAAGRRTRRRCRSRSSRTSSRRWVGGRSVAPGRRRARSCGSRRCRSARSAVATSDTSVAPRRRRRRRVEPGRARSVGCPVRSARVTTARPPTWASGRQASQWSSGPTPSRAVLADAERHGVVGQHDALRRRPIEPLVATTRASPGSTGRPPARGAPCRSVETMAAGAIAPARRPSRPAGSRWSTGKAASPSSQTSASASTNARSAREVEATSRAARHVRQVTRVDRRERRRRRPRRPARRRAPSSRRTGAP